VATVRARVTWGRPPTTQTFWGSWRSPGEPFQYLREELEFDIVFYYLYVSIDETRKDAVSVDVVERKKGSIGTAVRRRDRLTDRQVGR